MKYFDQRTPASELQDYLIEKQWMDSNEEILSLEKPGEGNMNVVLRIKTSERSFVLKQSRPFVQKYQQIAAPLNRIAVEHQFYNSLQNDALKPHIPKILGYDAAQYLLILEDLGRCEDMSTIYASRKITEDTLQKLVSILTLIHKSDVPDNFPENRKMRELNHQHIFVLPFLVDNGFQLDDIQKGLQELSMPYKQDASLKAVVEEIGNRYLSPGKTLLHGDYYPGSWMTESENLYVIDPEFGYVGFAEFDLGVMAAHIIMATADESYLNSIYGFYDGNANKKLLSQVAGIEIMRRLIGLAQLPLKRSIEEKRYLLELARNMILK